MNLREFGENTTISEPEQDEKQKKIEEITNSDEFKQIEDDYGDAVRDFISRYGEMSEPELLSEMLKLIAEKKREGTFDAEKIRQLAESVAPILTPEQREKMYNLLQYLN